MSLFLRCLLLVGVLALVGRDVQAQEPVYLLVRSDDLGMSHAKNVANEQLMKTGIPFSASVMFACPWYQEAVEILRRHPHVSVGVHLTLNSEWRGYRWGPVTGPEVVPSLVDSTGYFFPTRAELFDHQPVTAEVEHELRAQIRRALQSGLRIDYLDYHMGAAVTTPELRAVVEKLAEEFGLGISRYFGEAEGGGIYRVPPESKTDSLVAAVAALKPGLNLMVFHLGLETPEMDALVDMNAVGLPNMSTHRQAEMTALTSEAFRKALSTYGIVPMSYRDVIDRFGLASMKRPEGLTYGPPPR